MSEKQHRYDIQLTWTGNSGEGTTSYRAYRREHEIQIAGKPVLLGSSDPHFLGDGTRHNPEELFVASLSSCHMLWYLHLCAVNNVVVLEYSDSATGTLRENADGTGEFTAIELRPVVKIKAGSSVDKANELHDEAHHFCFLARSVKVPVQHKPTALVSET